MKLKVGVTGQNGFLGQHMYNTLRLHPDEFEPIDFDKSFFESENHLDTFVGKCDVIMHFAAMNRHDNENFIYETNVRLVEKLVASLERTSSTAHVVISSSTQEQKDNLYGRSKKHGRTLIDDWARKSGGKISGLIIPNVFGPFGKPFYNSFIATFCHQLTHEEQPEIGQDAEVKLIYVAELVALILNEIRKGISNELLQIEPTTTIHVSEVLTLLERYKAQYFKNGEIPQFKSNFEINLFNTYRSFIDHKSYYPFKLIQHIDPRGAFVEVIRLGIGGQVSFSTTIPGITRGNHYHTRKIERFAVIKGKALIQLRKIGTDEVLDFYLDGNEPAYVDMPIWYTHNIKNIGDENLYTNFWINEFYDPNDADTYFEEV